MLTRAALPALLFAMVGCGGARYPGGGATTAPAADGAKVPKGGIAAAALPYAIVDARTGRAVEEPAFWARLDAARAICVGEEHPNPHHHWLQLHVVQQLAARNAGKVKLALGLEMVQRPFQGVLEDYAARRIDAAALRSRVGWEERWGYPFDYYGPTIDAAVAGGADLLALNAARELYKKVSRQGLESLTPDERAQLPELDLADANHRAWFDALMNDMGGHGAHAQKQEPAPDAPASPPASPHGADKPTMPSPDRIYTVQVLWDETMADTGARWLASHPNGRLIILAGNGHCHDSAIISRLKRRGVTDAISLRPVIDADGRVAEVLAKPMNDYAVVMSVPK